MIIRVLLTVFLATSLYGGEKLLYFIDTNNINVRSSAAVEDNIIFTLREGAQNIKILNEVEGESYRWSEVEFDDKRRGWIVSEYIKSINSNFALAFYEKIGNLYRLRIWNPSTGGVDEVYTIENSSDRTVAYRKDAVAGSLLLHIDRGTKRATVTIIKSKKKVFEVENIIDAYWISNYKGLKRIRGHILVW